MCRFHIAMKKTRKHSSLLNSCCDMDVWYLIFAIELNWRISSSKFRMPMYFKGAIETNIKYEELKIENRIKGCKLSVGQPRKTFGNRFSVSIFCLSLATWVFWPISGPFFNLTFLLSLPRSELPLTFALAILNRVCYKGKN